MEFAGLSFAEAYKQDVFRVWDRLTNIRKPVRDASRVMHISSGRVYPMRNSIGCVLCMSHSKDAFYACPTVKLIDNRA